MANVILKEKPKPVKNSKKYKYTFPEDVTEYKDIREKHKETLVGIDISKSAINLATDYLSENNLYVVGDTNNLPLKNNSIDIVIDFSCVLFNSSRCFFIIGKINFELTFNTLKRKFIFFCG